MNSTWKKTVSNKGVGMEFIHYIDIDWPDLFRPILTTKTNFFNRIRIRREIIPIIFVPGIMGSRLENSKTGKIVWDPDRPYTFMLRKYGTLLSTPAKRKELLIGKHFNPNYLQVSERDWEHNQKFYSESDPLRDHRGWGGVSWGDYGGLLEELQNYNWNKALKNDDKDKKKEFVGKCFEFPVYAFGYNWTDTCLTSGKKLAIKIDEIIKGYKKRGRLCKYVILITHSMGGLVARSACCIEHEGIGKAQDKVLGVIHGVQPAVGAAAGYWRMKAGFERKSLSDSPVAWVLGTNGQEVTCILGNAPGGLELLPTKDYTQNDGSKQWLHVTLKNGKMLSLPKADPYAEIYRIGEETNIVTNKREAVFWRLVNPEWLDPMRSGAKITLKKSKTSLGLYLKCLELAEIFHNGLKTKFSKSTYQFYSSGLNTVDKISFTHEELRLISREDGLGVTYVEPNKRASSRGECTIYTDKYNQEIATPLPEPQKTLVACMSRIGDYHEGGDGTVPESSGSALKGEGILKVSKLKGYDHQSVYEKREARDFVFTAVRNLALKRIDEGINDGGVGTAK
jgi:hypothetical protein